MLSKRKLAALFSMIVAECLILPVCVIEVTEPAGAAHGYPAVWDSNGKKLAAGEFRQWIEDDHLYVVITYRFPDGQFFEEKARFRQHSELSEEQWSWNTPGGFV